MSDEEVLAAARLQTRNAMNAPGGIGADAPQRYRHYFVDTKVRELFPVVGGLAAGRVSAQAGAEMRVPRRTNTGMSPFRSEVVEAAAVDEAAARPPAGAAPKLLPRSTATREALADLLISDTNPEAPLSQVNAERALRGPPGSEIDVAGPGGEGADVVFRVRTRTGVTVVRREVKALSGASQKGFNRLLRKAASQIGYNGEVLMRVPAGTDAEARIEQFRGGLEPEAAGAYRSVNITIVTADGEILFIGPAVRLGAQ